MKIVVLLAAIILPCLMEVNGFRCNMPRQFFGNAIESSSSEEFGNHNVAVDFDMQIALYWKFQAPYNGHPLMGSFFVGTPIYFEMFNYKTMKHYTVDQDGTCTVETIDSGLTLPAVNPATDPVSNSGWSWAIFKRGGLKLQVSKRSCIPDGGNLFQAKWNKPIPLRFFIHDYPINNTDVLKADISMCTK